jgi:hypothetical protein
MAVIELALEVGLGPYDPSVNRRGVLLQMNCQGCPDPDYGVGRSRLTGVAMPANLLVELCASTETIRHIKIETPPTARKIPRFVELAGDKGLHLAGSTSIPSRGVRPRIDRHDAGFRSFELVCEDVGLPYLA